MKAALLALTVAVASVAGHTSAQRDQPAPATAASPPLLIDPTTAWRDIASAYQSKPTAERIAITAQVGDRPARRAELVVRLDPRRAANSKPSDALASASVLIDAGPLRIWAGPTGEAHWGMNAIFDKSLATIYSAKLDGPVAAATLRDLLPPTPLPQLALLRMDASAAPDDLTPYTGPVVWREAHLLDGPEDATYTITGTSADHHSTAETRVIADAKTGRLRSVRVTRPSINLTIELAISPLTVAADEPAKWTIDPANRRVVESLSALTQRDDPPKPAPAPTDPPSTPK